MIRRPISGRARIAWGVACVVLLATAYTYLSNRQHRINPRDTTIPSWSQLADGVVKVFTVDPNYDEYDGWAWIWIDARYTFGRHLLGLTVGVLLSVVLGLLMGCYSSVEAFFLPVLSFLAKIPPTAMMAVFFVLVGIGLNMYVAMIAFGVLPTLTQAVYQSVKHDVPEELIFKASTLGASQPELIWNLVFRQVLPRVLEAVRLQVGPAMVYLIAAEMLAADIGFGYRIRLQSRLLQMNVVYTYLAFLGAAGFLMDYSITWTRRKLCPWFGE